VKLRGTMPNCEVYQSASGLAAFCATLAGRGA
jgi:hypothetical protein